MKEQKDKNAYTPQPNVKLWNVSLQSDLAKPPDNAYKNGEIKKQKLEI